MGVGDCVCVCPQGQRNKLSGKLSKQQDLQRQLFLPSPQEAQWHAPPRPPSLPPWPGGARGVSDIFLGRGRGGDSLFTVGLKTSPF